MSSGTSPTAEPRLGTALLSLLSHDLRSPLGPLTLAATAISEDAGAPDDLRELARIVEAQASRIGRLIDAALAASANHRPLQMMPVDFAHIAEASAAGFTALGGSCDVEATACMGTGDATALRDAITGLLECVAGEGGRARLELSAEDGSACFRITGGRSAEAARALESELPSDWRAAFALGALALLAAHRGDARTSGGAIIARVPL